jgi:hypothetical protein
MEEEKIIACVYEKAGYWGVGDDHGSAEANLRQSALYFPKEALDDGLSEIQRRKMMSSTGRILTLGEAWALAHETGHMHCPLEEFLKCESALWCKKCDEYHINSRHFADALRCNYDPAKAYSFSAVHNHARKKELLALFPQTMSDKWAMRQAGD